MNFSLFLQFTEEIVSKYFQRFGEIEATKLKRCREFTEAYVLFKKGADATSVLITCNHKIGGHKIDLFASDRQSKDFLSDQMQCQDMDICNNYYDPSKRSLLDLNNDCIREILGILDTDEFCYLSMSHNRIKTIAEFVFVARRDKIISSLNSKRRMQLVIRAFGHLLTDFKIINTWYLYADYSSDLIQSLGRFCSGNLKTLHLDRIILKDEAVEMCANLFAYLEKLVLNNCSTQGTSFARVFQRARKLKSLKVYETSDDKINCDFLMHHFPQLESVRLTSLKHLQDSHLTTFIVKNPHVRKLKVIQCDNISTSIYRIISNNMKNLEDLRVYEINSRNFLKNMMHITKLRKLKKLNVYCNKNEVSGLITKLKSKKTLTHLQLSCTDASDELIQSILKLTNLVLLKFNVVRKFKESYIKVLKARCRKLKQIHFQSCSFQSHDMITKTVYVHRNRRSRNN